ncbi:MAG: MlaC/ttg2D family ABC transporter substrate-binding protein [Desulfohalobiaceae bacterium]
MLKRITLTILILLFTAGMTMAATPMETIQTAVDSILDILREPGAEDEEAGKGKARRIKEVVDNFFDYEVLSRVTLGRDWRQLSDEQKEEFVNLYSELLERSYLDRIYEYTDEEVAYVKETILTPEGARVPKAEVETVVTSGGDDLSVFYRLYEKDGKWLVYDLHGEGVGLVQNYRSQFDEMMHRGGAEGMLDKLRQKVSEMEDVIPEQDEDDGAEQ